MVPHRVALFLLLLHEHARAPAHTARARSHARIRRTHALAASRARGRVRRGGWGGKHNGGELSDRGAWRGGKQVESRARHRADRTCPEKEGGEGSVALVVGGKSQRRGPWWGKRLVEGSRARGAEGCALTRLTADYHYHYSCLSGATDSYVSERPL